MGYPGIHSPGPLRIGTHSQIPCPPHPPATDSTITSVGTTGCTRGTPTSIPLSSTTWFGSPSRPNRTRQSVCPKDSSNLICYVCRLDMELSNLLSGLTNNVMGGDMLLGINFLNLYRL